MLANIPVRERLRRQSQFHRPGLAWLNRDAPEAAQFLQRPFDLGLEVLDVELHDFFAGDLAAVLHVHADCDRTVLAQGLAAGLDVRVVEGRIAQAVAERIEEFALEIHVGPPMTDVVIHQGWNLIQRFGPGLANPPARVVVAEENIGQGIALLLAAVGQVEDGRDILLGPVDGVGETGDEDNHRLGIGREDLLDQFLLPATQGNVLPIDAFATLAVIVHLHPLIIRVRTVAHANDGDIRGLGQRDRRRHVLPVGVFHGHAETEFVLDAR